MKNASIVVGVLILIFVVGYFVTNEAEAPVAITQETEVQIGTEEVIETEMNTETAAVIAEETAPVEAGMTETKEAKAVVTETVPKPAPKPVVAEVNTAGTYETYSADKFAESDAEHKILFFHATWCPSCRSLDNDITANAGSIPSNVAIFKIDYDTSTDLKRKYGVTTQHSLIEIGDNGVAESKITHPSTLKGVLATI